MKRKLPDVGDAVAYTRAALPTFRDRADWRARVIARCDFWTPDWPMLEIEWLRGEAKGQRSNVNAGNLCTTRSVAFIET